MNRFMRILLGLVAVLALSVVLAACGDEESDSGAATSEQQQQQKDSSEGGLAISDEEKAENAIEPVEGASGTTITVGSKNFTEQFILGEIYAQALEAAGYSVRKDLNLGSEVVAFKALQQGDIDAYPEYTGTALTSFFDVEIADVPKDAQQAYADAREAYAEEGITALEPTPFENTYRLGMTKERAAQIGNPTKISDLEGEAKNLAINGFPECRQRIDCLLGVEKFYGLDFEKFLPGDNKYQILDNGNADVAFVFTTDGNLASGDYQVLDDDKSIFPPYNITFSVRDEVAKKLGPEGQAVVKRVQKYMTEEVMQELNARVDLEKQEPARVAADYLRFFGFTS